VVKVQCSGSAGSRGKWEGPSPRGRACVGTGGSLGLSVSLGLGNYCMCQSTSRSV